MKKNMKKWVSTIAAVVALMFGALVLTACSSDADTVSYNLSQDADQFKIERRIIFYNGITDGYILTVEGRCSITDEGNQLEVVCKYGPDQYKKHFLGLSDNVTYFAEQLENADASEYHYKVIFKPESILPITVDVETKSEDGPGH